MEASKLRPTRMDHMLVNRFLHYCTAEPHFLPTPSMQLSLRFEEEVVRCNGGISAISELATWVPTDSFPIVIEVTDQDTTIFHFNKNGVPFAFTAQDHIALPRHTLTNSILISRYTEDIVQSGDKKKRIPRLLIHDAAVLKGELLLDSSAVKRYRQLQESAVPSLQNKTYCLQWVGQPLAAQNLLQQPRKIKIPHEISHVTYLTDDPFVQKRSMSVFIPNNNTNFK